MILVFYGWKELLGITKSNHLNFQTGKLSI